MLRDNEKYLLNSFYGKLKNKVSLKKWKLKNLCLARTNKLIKGEIYSSRFLNSIKQSEPEKFWKFLKIIGRKWAYVSSRRTFLRDICHFRTLNLSSYAALNISWLWSLSYRNQSIDLLGKSMYWFLYDFFMISSSKAIIGWPDKSWI